MAIAGGATSAYRCQVVDDALEVTPTTAMRSLCAPVDIAIVQLAYGERVTVAGGDMAELRKRLGVRSESDVQAQIYRESIL